MPCSNPVIPFNGFESLAASHLQAEKDGSDLLELRDVLLLELPELGSHR